MTAVDPDNAAKQAHVHRLCFLAPCVWAEQPKGPSSSLTRCIPVTEQIAQWPRLPCRRVKRGHCAICRIIRYSRGGTQSNFCIAFVQSPTYRHLSMEFLHGHIIHCVLLTLQAPERAVPCEYAKPLERCCNPYKPMLY